MFIFLSGVTLTYSHASPPFSPLFSRQGIFSEPFPFELSRTEISFSRSIRLAPHSLP